MGLRLFESISKIPTTTSNRPFSFQSKLLDQNSATIAFQVGKSGAAKSISASYLKKYAGDYSTSAITTAASINDSTLDVKHKAAAKSLQDLVNKSPKDIGLAFTAVQAHMRVKNINGAIQIAQNLVKVLEDEPTKRFLPAVVGMIVGLYDIQGRKGGAKEELDKATAYWKEQSHPVSSS